jgi:hypothetical protein
MSLGQSFNRFEKKYLVTKAEKDELVDFLSQYLTFDDYSKDDYYTIYNIYYDTSDQNIIRQSVDRPPYKAKLRLRSYTCPVQPSDLVFLEIKKKIDGKVTKRRLIMTYDEANRFVLKGIKPKVMDYMSNQVLNEIDYYLKRNQVQPNYFIAYERRAMADAQNLLRVTIDKRIDIRREDVSFLLSGGHSLLPKDHYLIEIKSGENFPIWLAHKLSQMNLFARSFSKYGEAYRISIQGEEL